MGAGMDRREQPVMQAIESLWGHPISAMSINWSKLVKYKINGASGTANSDAARNRWWGRSGTVVIVVVIVLTTLIHQKQKSKVGGNSRRCRRNNSSSHCRKSQRGRGSEKGRNSCWKEESGRGQQSAIACPDSARCQLKFLNGIQVDHNGDAGTEVKKWLVVAVVLYDDDDDDDDETNCLESVKKICFSDVKSS